MTSGSCIEPLTTILLRLGRGDRVSTNAFRFAALHESAFGPKRTSNPLSRSIRGKADMKHTSRDFGIGAFGALENSLVIEVIGWLDARQKHWQPAHWARSPGNWRV